MGPIPTVGSIPGLGTLNLTTTMSGSIRQRVAALLPALLLLTACHSTAPRSWLRFAAASEKGFNREPDGRLRQDLGPVAIYVDLGKKDTRLEVTAENRGKSDVEIKAGADGASTTAAIGEVWRRPIGAGNAEDVPEAVPYRANDAVELRPGWRAVFFLDSPLGRDLVLGQQVMFNIQTRDPATGLHDHITLPLVATNVPAERARR